MDLLPKLVSASLLPLIMNVPGVGRDTAGLGLFEVPPADKQIFLPSDAFSPPTTTMEVDVPVTASLAGLTGAEVTVGYDEASAFRRLDAIEERRLNELMMKKATGEISLKEDEELLKLDARRGLDEPVPEPEAIADRERLLSKIDDLLQELSHFGKNRS